MPSLPPELALTLTLCLLPLTEQERENAPRLAADVRNWDEFTFWTLRHGVVGSVLANIKSLGLNIPPATLARLEALHRQASLRDMQLIAALGQLDALFTQNGLAYLTLKGPALSQALFGSPFVRHSGDVDILVALEDVKRAEKILLAWGCQRKEPAQELTSKQFEYYLKFKPHTTFASPKGIPIELHWTIREPYLFSTKASQKMIERNAEVHIANRLTVKTLSKEDIFIHALLHGAVHRWHSAKFMRDLVGANHDKLNADLIQKTITEEGLQVIAGQASALGKKFFEREFSSLNFFSVRKLEKSITFTTNVAIQNMLARDPVSIITKPRRIQYEPKLKPGWRYFYYSIFKSFINAKYWQQTPLPDLFFFLYFFVIPVMDFYYKLIHPIFSKKDITAK